MIFLYSRGPNSLDVILVTNTLSYLSVALIVFMFLSAYKKKKIKEISRVPLTFVSLIFLFHPAWMMSARHGDAGILKFLVTLLVTYISIRILTVKPSPKNHKNSA